jgi:hypothetical protein
MARKSKSREDWDFFPTSTHLHTPFFGTTVWKRHWKYCDGRILSLNKQQRRDSEVFVSYYD